MQSGGPIFNGKAHETREHTRELGSHDPPPETFVLPIRGYSARCSVALTIRSCAHVKKLFQLRALHFAVQWQRLMTNNNAGSPGNKIYIFPDYPGEDKSKSRAIIADVDHTRKEHDFSPPRPP